MWYSPIVIPSFSVFFLKHETLLFFWDLVFLSTSLLFLVFIFSHMRLLNRFSIARFHVPGHVGYCISHYDDLVLGLLEQVTLIFFSFGLMSFCLGSLMPAF